MNSLKRYFLITFLISICGCGEVEIDVPDKMINHDLDAGNDVSIILDAEIMDVSSEGNKSVCQQACEYSLSCGIDLCKQYNDCMNISPQLECSLNCVLLASCEDIIQLNMKNYNTKLGKCSNECWK